jgi:hypothetical protein
MEVERPALLDDMTFSTCAVGPEHRLDGLHRRHVRAPTRPGILERGADLANIAGAATGRRAQLERARRRSAAIEFTKVRDYLIWRAVAQGTNDIALLLEAEAVAGTAILFHVDRLKAGPVGRRRMTVGAAQSRAAAVALTHSLRHPRDPALRIEMHLMGE